VGTKDFYIFHYAWSGISSKVDTYISGVAMIVKCAEEGGGVEHLTRPGYATYIYYNMIEIYSVIN